MLPAAERPRSSSTVSICDQPSVIRRSRMAYCNALLSRLCRTWWAEDCRTYRIALRARWCGRILSDVIACLLWPVSVARVIEEQLHHQACQRPASLLRKCAPSRHRRRRVAGCREQIELCRPGSMVVTHLALASHRDLPDSHRERPPVRRQTGYSMIRRRRPTHPPAASSTRPAKRYRPTGGRQCASVHTPPGRASTSAIPVNGASPRRPGCSERHGRSPSRSPHGH